MRKQLAYAVAVSALTTVVFAQQLSETIEVRVANVDVVVTDRQGHPIRGLTKDDFEVYENKKRQPITNFYAVTGGRTILADGSEISLSSPPAPAAAAEIPAALKAKYVVYVDNLNIHPLHRTRVFRSVYDFLDKAIGPNAEGAVVKLTRLEVAQHFLVLLLHQFFHNLIKAFHLDYVGVAGLF